MSLRRCLLLVMLPLVFIPVRGDDVKPRPPRIAAAAIDRAVAALRKMQRGDGSWGIYGPGSTALVTLALIEAGVKTDDPVIGRAATYVRFEAVTSQHTYSLALSAILLERIGDPKDEPLLKLLVERIVDAQRTDGGWEYFCKCTTTRGIETTLPHPGQRGEEMVERHDQKVGERGASDNSNTQFAVLGLWAGRKLNSGVEEALRRCEERFRKTSYRMPNGTGWGYLNDDRFGVTGSRTCMALMGLAVNYGMKIERTLRSPNAPPGDEKPDERLKNPLDEALVRDALKFVAAEYQTDCAQPFVQLQSPDYYFYWSVERVAVTYGLTRLHGLDWYAMGVNRLLPYQGQDGLWTGRYTPDTDTSLVLLFLTRSTLSRELSAVIAKRAQMKTVPGAAGADVVDRLVRELLATPVARQQAIIEEYRDAKGVEYSDALARAIAKLAGENQKRARDCLAQRLARMTADTLRARLKEPDAEIRRAAAVACAMKEDKTMIPDLIRTLDDTDGWVVRAAGVALSRLTGQDFGPPPNAAPEVRAKAVAAWKAWWRTQPK